jgi:signal peptidase I
MTEQFDGSRSHAVQAIPRIRAMRNFGPVTIPAGSYFMMGDNRDNSADSRYFGFVPRENILGRSTAVVASFDPETHLPRWNRTCKTLP